MTTKFDLTDVEARDDDGPAELTLSTEFDGFPIQAKITYVDALSVLKFFHRMGRDEAILNLAETLQSAEEEQDL